MRHQDFLFPDTVVLYKKGGGPVSTASNPIKAQVSKGKIITQEQRYRFERGDRITRRLPTGQEEEYWVLDAVFHDGGSMARDLSNWEIEVTRNRSDLASAKPATMQTINVSGGNVQIGNSNTQEIGVVLAELVATIDSSGASQADRQEAKGHLRRFLEHPLVAAVAGAAASTLMATVFKSD